MLCTHSGVVDVNIGLGVFRNANWATDNTCTLRDGHCRRQSHNDMHSRWDYTCRCQVIWSGCGYKFCMVWHIFQGEITPADVRWFGQVVVTSAVWYDTYFKERLHLPMSCDSVKLWLQVLYDMTHILRWDYTCRCDVIWSSYGYKCCMIWHIFQGEITPADVRWFGQVVVTSAVWYDTYFKVRLHLPMSGDLVKLWLQVLYGMTHISRWDYTCRCDVIRLSCGYKYCMVWHVFQGEITPADVRWFGQVVVTIAVFECVFNGIQYSVTLIYCMIS